jgi:hypothetical protein
MEANSGAVLPPSLGAAGAGTLSRTGNGVAFPSGASDVRVADVAAARAELGRPIDLPPEGRLSAATLATLAAAAGVVAILVGGWAFVSGVRDGGGSTEAAAASPPTAFEEAVTLLADPGTERLPLAGSVGRIVLVVRETGDAALVLNGLGVVDSGWAYQAWVSRPNALTPLSAALFSGREAVVRLAAPVPRGATVAVTLEPEEGSFAPTRTPKLVVQRPA